MTLTSLLIPAANNPIPLFRAVRALIGLSGPSEDLADKASQTYAFSAVKGFLGVYQIFTVSGPLAGWEIIKRIRRFISSVEWISDTPLMVDVLKLPYETLALTVLIIRCRDPVKVLLNGSLKVLRISIFLVPTSGHLLSFAEAAIKTAEFFYSTYGPNAKAA